MQDKKTILKQEALEQALSYHPSIQSSGRNRYKLWILVKILSHHTEVDIAELKKWMQFKTDKTLLKWMDYLRDAKLIEYSIMNNIVRSRVIMEAFQATYEERYEALKNDKVFWAHMTGMAV